MINMDLYEDMMEADTEREREVRKALRAESRKARAIKRSPGGGRYEVKIGRPTVRVHPFTDEQEQDEMIRADERAWKNTPWQQRICINRWNPYGDADYEEAAWSY